MSWGYTGYGRSSPRNQPTKPEQREYGWLTPIRATAGCAKTWLWSCRCGETITRECRQVLRAVREGREPRCSPKCLGAPAKPE